MNSFLAWITNHPALSSLAAGWAFSAVVSGMPAPTPTSSVGYVWLFNTLHFVASNLNAVFAKKGIPRPGSLPEEATSPSVVPNPNPKPAAPDTAPEVKP